MGHAPIDYTFVDSVVGAPVATQIGTLLVSNDLFNKITNSLLFSIAEGRVICNRTGDETPHCLVIRIPVAISIAVSVINEISADPNQAAVRRVGWPTRR